MPFAFDAGDLHPDIQAVSSSVEETQLVRIVTWQRAQNIFNKIRANIETHELPEALDDYMRREALTLDALHLFDPTISAELQEIYETHRSCLVHGGAARPAQPGNPAQDAQNGNIGKDQEDYW